MLREDRLTAVIQNVADDTHPRVLLAPEMKPGRVGSHNGWGEDASWALFVLEALSDPEAEAVALHELAHIYLDHDDDAALRAIPEESEERSPWEFDADALAAAMVEDGASLMTDPQASIDYLFAFPDRS